MAYCWPAILCLAILLLASWHRFRRLSPYLITAFFFVIGCVHCTLSLLPPAAATDIYHLARQRREVSLVGVLVRSPEIGPERSTLLMELKEIMDKQGVMTEAGGLIQLALAAPPPLELIPGDLFIARATIGPVASFGIPGVFNYQEYLGFQGIRASGWIRSPALIMEISRAVNPSWLEQLRYLPEVIRYRLSQFLAASLPPETAGVYQAILLGERANLSPKVQDDFKASGSVHILSISGLHMALVSLCVTLLISWLLRRSEWVLLHLSSTKVAALLSLVPLTAYAMIAGFDPPVVRSLIMVAVFIMALLVDRQWSIPNNIAIAAFLLLALNPALLFTASFQLTFAAVAAIALFAPMVARIIDQPSTDEQRLALRLWSFVKKWALASILVSVAATLGTAPILAYQFNQVSLLSPLSTLLIEPFLCLWSLMLGLTACLLIGIPPLAHLLLDLGSIGITVSLYIADLCARLPWSFVRLPTPAMPHIIAWYGMMFLLAYCSRLSRRQVVSGGLVCLGLAVSPFLPMARVGQETTLTVLDVGQGSAMVIELPSHEFILVDGGRKQAPSAHLDVGEDLIAPFLWHKRIRRLAAVVCTHPDADHYNGIPFILQQFRPQTLWVNGHESEDKGYGQMLELASRLKIETRIPAAGTVLLERAGVTLTTLTGGQVDQSEQAGRAGKDASERGGNNQSLVLRLSHGQATLLLPSDIEGETEQALLEQDSFALKADVLVAPHHGSATSSAESFVRAVSPRYVAISAGRNQDAHFPDPETVARYQKIGSVILNTAEHGSLFFHSNGQDVRVDTYR